MKQGAIYKITVYREWREYGYLEIDGVEDEDDAREEARFALATDDDAILWHSDKMEPEGQGIESVEYSHKEDE